jgi:hypothetical protein
MTNSDRVVIDYTNHRGERATRYITPLPGGIKFTSSEWHPEPQWLMSAFDVDKQVWRDFAMKDIHGWRPSGDIKARGEEVSPIWKPDLEKFLDGVVGIIEANDYEVLSLWQERRNNNLKPSWESSLSGMHMTVGFVGADPVAINLRTAVVDGHKVLFFDASSQVVDHRLIDSWLRKNLPRSAFRPGSPEQINRTDAMNFYNVMPRG